MKNVVAKTALKTFIIVVVALIAAFAVASLGFPRHMATLFENIGNYSFATGYASLAYKYSDTFDNLVRCVDDSILSKDDGNIVNFASKMVADERFGDYCARRDEAVKARLENGGVAGVTDYSYKQYVMGNLSCSQYALGFKDEALKTAASALEDAGFPENNALAMLALKAGVADDADMKKSIYDSISSREVKPEEEEYRAAVLEILN